MLDVFAGFRVGCGSEHAIARQASNILLIIGIFGLIAILYYYSQAKTKKDKKVIVRYAIFGFLTVATGWFLLSFVANCTPGLN